MNILICDSNPSAGGEMKQHLAERGHTVAPVVTTVDDIVYAVSVNQPDLVFVSFAMLGADCFDTIRRIHHFTQVPVIIQTVQRTDAFLRQASAAGASWILEEPGDPAAIDLAISIALIRHQDFLELQRLRESTARTVREFLHRIKNDLAILTSLMHLQAGCSSHSDTAEAIFDSADRVRVIAALYDIIRSSDYNDVLRLDDYIELLISKLSHGIDGEDGCSVEVATDYIVSDGMTSLHCGLLINELVANALKHAFPAIEKNIHIIVTVKKIAVDDSIEICVSDNGIGLPPDIDPAQATSFGFQLISLLVHQLKGRMEVTRSGGTRFTVTFNSPISNEAMAKK